MPYLGCLSTLVLSFADITCVLDESHTHTHTHPHTEYTEYQSRLRHELEQHHHHQQASQAAFTKPVNPSHSLLPLNATPPSQETLQQLHQEPFPDYSPEDTSPLFVEAGVANHDSSLFYNPSSHNPAPSNGQSYHLTPRRLPSDGAIVLRQQSLSSQSSHSLHSASSFPDHSGYQHYPPQQQHLNNAAFGVYSTSASASASGSDVSIASCGPRYGRYQEVLEASAPPAAAYVYDGTNLVTRRGRRRLVNPVSGTQTPPPNLVPHSRSLSYQHAVIRPVRSYEWIPFTTTKPQHTPLAPPPHHAHTAPIVVGGKTTPNHPRTTPTQAPATPTSNQSTYMSVYYLSVVRTLLIQGQLVSPWFNSLSFFLRMHTPQTTCRNHTATSLSLSTTRLLYQHTERRVSPRKQRCQRQQPHSVPRKESRKERVR